MHLGHKGVQSGGQHLGRTDGGRDEICQHYAASSPSKNKIKIQRYHEAQEKRNAA